MEDSLSLAEADGTWQIPLKAYEPKKLIFSLYVEGWDLDNTNITLNGQFDAHIAFKIYR